MSEKEHYIIRDKEGKLLNGYNGFLHTGILMGNYSTQKLILPN